VAATIVSVALAHFAVALAWQSERLLRLRMWALPVLAAPHLAIAIGLVLLLSPSGLLLRALSPWATGFTQPPDWATVQDPLGIALIVGLIVKEVPFLILVLLGSLAQVDADRLMLQARVLGYGRLKSWLVAVAPLAQRQSRLATAAVLVFGITNVEVALPLGPSTPPTLSMLLLRWFTDADLAMRLRAFAGTWLLLGITVFALIVVRWIARSFASVWREWATSGRRAVKDRLVKAATVIPVTLVSALGISALIALLLRSIGGAWRFPDAFPARPSLDAWQSVASELDTSVGSTLMLGLATAAAAVLLVLAAAEALHDRPRLRRSIAVALFVPLLLPQMAFLFGLQTFLIRLGIDGTFAAVLWSHLIFALPYVWAVLSEARAQLPAGLASAARVLGATAPRTWLTVVVPLLAKSVLLAFALGFAVSVALYLPTLFAGTGRITTATTAAAAAMGAGNLRSAATQALVLSIVPLLVFASTAALAQGLYRDRLGMPR
ncbi:MAG: ABC transporter permease, partial [Dehalococcoidia bacterium]